MLNLKNNTIVLRAKEYMQKYENISPEEALKKSYEFEQNLLKILLYDRTEETETIKKQLCEDVYNKIRSNKG